MGWQDLHPLVRRAYQSKGGSVRTAKGYAKMDKEKHLEASSTGGKNKRDNYSRKGAEQTQDSVSSHPQKLEDILGTLNEL